MRVGVPVKQGQAQPTGIVKKGRFLPIVRNVNSALTNVGGGRRREGVFGEGMGGGVTAFRG